MTASPDPTRVRARRRPRTTRARIVVGAVLAVFALAFAYFVVTFVQVWQAARADDARSAEAIVVLGAAQFDGRPSKVFAARLDHAADLYDAGIAPLIVVTGGRQEGDRFTEATAGADHLHRRGVPDDAILREVQGRSTYESLQATRGFLTERGIDDVVLVTDPFHAMRARLVAQDVGMSAVTSPTPTSPVRGWSERVRFVGETVRVMIGRVIGFDRLQRTLGVGILAVAMLGRSPAGG